MSQLRKNAAPNDDRLTRLAFRDRDREPDFAAQADRVLAGYPANIREQFTDILRILAAKPKEAEDGVR